MGDNGKSTLLELFRVLFGDYAATINVDSLMAKQIGNNELADLADLRGARFVRSSETEQGQRLNESRLKRITQGMGVIRTCRKYENMIEFPETHTLWIDANHKPTVRGQDNAIWNRLALIPFEITIPKSEQDQNLGTKLLNEAEGILAWAVAGAVKWHQEGLQRPPEVNQAVATWRAESDPLNDFIEEHCEVKPDLWSPSGTLWREYEQWTEASGVDALSRTAFNTRLRNMGCKANRRKIGNKTTRIFEGITLLG
jgi:putative DNA primase/helicase